MSGNYAQEYRVLLPESNSVGFHQDPTNINDNGSCGNTSYFPFLDQELPFMYLAALAAQLLGVAPEITPARTVSGGAGGVSGGNAGVWGWSYDNSTAFVAGYAAIDITHVPPSIGLEFASLDGSTNNREASWGKFGKWGFMFNEYFGETKFINHTKQALFQDSFPLLATGIWWLLKPGVQATISMSQGIGTAEVYNILGDPCNRKIPNVLNFNQVNWPLPFLQFNPMAASGF